MNIVTASALRLTQVLATQTRTLIALSVSLVLLATAVFAGVVTANAATGTLSSLSLNIASDGTAPFDADDAPGNDALATNGIVRGMDTVTYRWDYAVSQAGDVTFTQTLPVGMVWLATESLASCTGAGSNVSADKRTITCNFPGLSVGVGSYLVKARVGALAHASTLSSTVSAGSLTSATASVTVSSKPMVGLNYLRALGDGLLTYGGVDGFQFRDGFDIFVPSAGTKGWRGAENLDSSFTFTVNPPTNVPDVTLVECGAGTHNTAKQPNPSGGTVNSVVNSGTWTCVQPGGPGTPVTVTVSGLDSSLLSYPSKFGNNGVINNTRAYMGVGKITWFVPRSALPNTSVDLKFTTTNFDPTSSTGASNYGTGFATNYAASAPCVIGSETVDGNCVDRSMSLAPQPLLSSASTTNQTGGAIPGGVLYANQPFAFITNTYNAQTNLPQTNAVLCSRWNNQLSTINPSSPVIVNFGQATYLVEYGNVPYSTDTQRKVPDCGKAGDGNPNWHTSIAAAGGAASVTAVRVTMLTGSIPAAQGVNFLVPMIRTGTQIPAGSPVYQFTSLYTSQFGWTATPGFNPATGSGLGGSRSLASIAKTSNTITWDVSTTAPGSTRTVTINSAVTVPYATTEVVTAEQVRISVTMPTPCETYVSGSANRVPEQITPANLGADGMACTADDGSGEVVVFNLGDVAVGTTIAPVTLQTNISSSAPAPVVHTIKSVISSPSDIQVHTDRTSYAAITINSLAEFSVTKQASVSKAFNNVPYSYSIGWSNRLSSTVGVVKIVDVLPFNGDSRGTQGVESVSFVSASSTTAGVSYEYTTMTSSALQSAIASDPTGDTGVTWVSSQPSSGVTGIRIVTPSLGAGAVGSATLTVKASGLSPTAQIVNSVNAKAANVPTPIVSAGVVTVGSYASSVSGSIYTDTDYSWTKNAGDAELAGTSISYTGYTFGPNGINENGAGDDLAVTTPVSVVTDASGNYVFGSVDPGLYTFVVTAPAGYSAGQTPTNPVTISANQNYALRNFGFIVDVPNPVLVQDTGSTAQGVAKNLNVLANDTLDASAVITAVSSGSAGGSIVIASDGKSVVYTPAAQFVGTETFTYTITDKGRQTGTATVTMTVIGPPTARDDEVFGVKNTSKTISVLTNDLGVNLGITAVGTTPHGTVTTSGTTVTFVPTTGFTGLTSFTYTVTDSIGQSATAQVTIRVLPPLVAVNDSATTGVNTSAFGIPVTIPILANDSGENFTRTAVSTPSLGSVTFNSNGEAIYTPNGSQIGTDSFTYTITDSAGQTSTATVTVKVSSPPVLVDDTRRIKKDTSVTLNVLGNDLGQSLAVQSTQNMSSTSGSPHGTAVISSDGTVTFTPTSGFTGLATFTYSAKDAYNQVLNATVKVTVVAPPVASPINRKVGPSSTNIIDLGIFVNAPSGSVVVADSVTQPSLGTAHVQSTTSLRYQAPSSTFGTTTFGYTVTDDLGQSSTSTVDIEIIPAPRAVADDSATTINTPVTLNVLGNDSGDAIEILTVDTPQSGTVDLDPSNHVVFTPSTGWFGTAVFNYSIKDSLGQTAMAAVTVQVFPALTAEDTRVTTIKGSAVKVPFTFPSGVNLKSIGTTSHGTFTIKDDGSVWFTPQASYLGTFSVPFTVEDNAGQRSTANLQVTVTDHVSTAASLAITGVSVWSPLYTSIIALLLGIFLLMRRKNSES